VAEDAQVIQDALNVVVPRRAELGVLRWLPDAPTPRRMENLSREKVTDDYLTAFEELAYAHLTGEASGLISYFAQGALDDAYLATSSPNRAHVASWDHRLKLQFYAPDGGTVAFSDRHWYAQALEEGRDLRDFRVAQRTLQVVMGLDEGVWRIHTWRVLEDISQDGFDSYLESGLKNVTAEPVPPYENIGDELADVRGVNYIARNAPFDLFWPNFNRTEVEDDFRLISSLGLNTVRFFIPYPMPKEVRKALPQVLDLANTYKLNLIPTLLDSYTAYRVQDMGAVMRYLHVLVPLLKHKTVFAVDVKNEADRDFPQAGKERVRTFLSFFAQRTRTLTGKPITAGLISPDLKLSYALDFVTLHHYLEAEALPERLAQARSLRKPVLLEEFGFHSQSLRLPDPHTEMEQAWYFEQLLEIADTEDVGWMFWTLHDLPDGPVPVGGPLSGASAF
jgi:hypothetical protein